MRLTKPHRAYQFIILLTDTTVIIITKHCQYDRQTIGNKLPRKQTGSYHKVYLHRHVLKNIQGRIFSCSFVNSILIK